MQKVVNFNNAAIVSVKETDYRIHVWSMSKDNTTSIMSNSDLSDKSSVYMFFFYYYM